MALGVVKFDLNKRVKLAQGLWLMYWLAVMASITLFGLGLYFKIELKKRSEMMDNNESHCVPHLLILVGLIGVGVNAFGGKVCNDSLDPTKFPKWKPMVKPYLTFCFGFNVALFVMALLCFLMQFALYFALAEGLKNGIRYYKDTDTPGRCFMKRTLDLTQIEFRCCGNNNYRDWFEVQWISNRYLDFNNDNIKDRVLSNVEGKFLMDSVPFSCCNPGSPRPCIQHHLTNNTAHYDYDHRSDQLNIWTRGCREALVSYYGGMMNSIGALVLVIIFLEIGVMAGLQYLTTSLETLTDPENPESESEGWLLEKSVKETISDMCSKVKGLVSRGNAVEEGGEEAAAS